MPRYARLVGVRYFLRYGIMGTLLCVKSKTLHQGIGMLSDILISTDYWTDLQITQQDVDFLHNHLFEYETPLTARELVGVLVHERIRNERLEAQRKRQAGGRIYLPFTKLAAWDGGLHTPWGKSGSRSF